MTRVVQPDSCACSCSSRLPIPAVCCATGTSSESRKCALPAMRENERGVSKLKEAKCAELALCDRSRRRSATCMNGYGDKLQLVQVDEPTDLDEICSLLLMLSWEAVGACEGDAGSVEASFQRRSESRHSPLGPLAPLSARHLASVLQLSSSRPFARLPLTFTLIPNHLLLPPHISCHGERQGVCRVRDTAHHHMRWDGS